LLSYHTRQSDIVIGSPFANREVEVEELIGLFLNTLVLRTDLSGDPTFREVLRRVREVSLSAYAHRETPFEKLVEILHPERNLGHNPLFQVWFVLQDLRIHAPDPPGLKLVSLPIEDARTRHDLQLTMWQTVDGLRGSFEYSSELFDAATIAGISQHFETILHLAVEQPDVRLSGIKKILDEACQQQNEIREKLLKEGTLEKLKKIKRKVIASTPTVHGGSAV